MKKIFLLAILILSGITGFSEAFDITAYFIDMKMNANSSIVVTETIDVHYKEQRHGIIRSIPFRYSQFDFPGKEKAERASFSADYELLIKDISVEGFEFTPSYEGDFLKIKIGSADKYVEGNQKYVIRYVVWGGLNKFSDHTELYWNLIGHQWDCSIAKAGFNISLPKSLKLTNDDILLFTGPEGSKDNNAVYKINPTSITGSLTAALNANEGMTLVVRFPLSFFENTNIPITDLAKNFYTDKLNIKVKINNDASLDIEEKYDVVLIFPQTSFNRDFNTLKPNDTSLIKDYILKNVSVNYITPGVNDAQFYAQREGKNKFINLYSSKEFSGKITVTYRYKVWGAVRFERGRAEIQWPFTGEMSGEPFNGFTAEISADPAINIENTLFRFFRTSEDHPVTPDLTWDVKTKTYIIKYDKVFATDAVIMTESLSDAGFDKTKMPIGIFAKNYYINDFLTEITINKNGSLHIKQLYKVMFKNPAGPDHSFTANENFSYYDDLAANKGLHVLQPDWSLLSGYTKLLVNNLTVSGQDDAYRYGNSYYNSIYWGNDKATADSLFSYEYDIFGLFSKVNGTYFLNKPLLSALDEPVKKGTIRIILPEGVKADMIKTLFDINNDTLQLLKFTTSNNIITCKLNRPLMANETPFLKIWLPKNNLSVSGMLTWKIIWKNNKLLFYPFILLIILFIIWFFFGRDKRTSIVVQYKPPKDITPAEAGFLWDNKLHKRDLVSLIYYWAGHGLISIKEIKAFAGSKDYELTKLRELPDDAKNFERKMFGGLFKDRNNTVKVSSLKNSFYITMNETDKELHAYSKKQQFYVPGTRGFSTFLKIISFFILGIGIFASLFSGYSWLQFQFCIVLSSGLVYLFGMIMPKRGHFGMDRYMELLGFREFIERAESDKLKGLLQENPRYFDETVSFAIVMGLGSLWAEKFKDLINSAPVWYQSADHGTFTTSLLVSSMISSMYHMDHNFNYHYTPGSSSGSGSHSSGFSSFGGGGGFSGFGGGGFSGGGFGGGGGSSW